jgi:hypothetical protein
VYVYVAKKQQIFGEIAFAVVGEERRAAFCRSSDRERQETSTVSQCEADEETRQ